jgi:hypothetical protein
MDVLVAAAAAGKASSDIAHLEDLEDLEEVSPQDEPYEVGSREVLQPLRDFLVLHQKALQNEDPACTVVVLQINRLGNHCREVLKRHYSQYGEVSRVLIQQTMVKPSSDCFGHQRLRPGGLGLVVMKREAAIKKILAEGRSQGISGQYIVVERFQGKFAHRDAGLEGKFAHRDAGAGCLATTAAAEPAQVDTALAQSRAAKSKEAEVEDGDGKESSGNGASNEADGEAASNENEDAGSGSSDSWNAKEGKQDRDQPSADSPACPNTRSSQEGPIDA